MSKFVIQKSKIRKKGSSGLFLGQSLFEVLVAIAIAALIMTGIVSLTTVAVSNSTRSKNNALATKYTQEAQEWIREQRDIDWINISSRSPGSYCIGDPPQWVGGCTIDGIFDRRVEFRNTGDGSVEAVVVVSWTEGGRDNVVNSTTRLTNWNR